ncbi:MAG: hypothetical protein L0Z53_18580, partial [Acidobacteriales bacterium]|nr:hypothetical protein [Terriglobales bacterium]
MMETLGVLISFPFDFVNPLTSLRQYKTLQMRRSAQRLRSGAAAQRPSRWSAWLGFVFIWASIFMTW